MAAKLQNSQSNSGRNMRATAKMWNRRVSTAVAFVQQFVNARPHFKMWLICQTQITVAFLVAVMFFGALGCNVLKENCGRPVVEEKSE